MIDINTIQSKFTCNKYLKRYIDLVSNRKTNLHASTEYVEKHHIIPRSLGGPDESDNLVFLNFREHVLAHRLLTRITSGKDRARMFTALIMMMGTRKCTTKMHMKEAARVREEHAKSASAILKGRAKTADHVNKINRNPEKIEKTRQKHLGSKRTDESKQKMSERRKKTLADRGGALNKGHKQFYNPEDHSQTMMCPEGDQPAGWIKGNPKMLGRKKYHHPETKQVKRFLPGSEPEGWIIGLP